MLRSWLRAWPIAVLVLLLGCADDPGSMERSVSDRMVLIVGGEFSMGIDHPMMPEARPVHRVVISDFYIDAAPVTNRQFAVFVAQTGYITLAERPLDPAQFPGVDEALLVPGSIVFDPPAHPVSTRDERQWWTYVPGAYWRQPEGPQSSIDDRLDHPAVHIAWSDAVAYADWAGKRLPTEAEWEYAARGGLQGQEFTWGDEAQPEGMHMANVFQGHFPHQNLAEDGHHATSPVGSFPANGYGLVDMSGNVWEWVSDWYSPVEYGRRVRSGESVQNPQGPEPSQAYMGYKVQKGGSFLCTDQYCARFRPGARGRGDPESTSNHIGFRLVKDAVLR